MAIMKTLIVEGKTDKERVRKMLDEPVQIICTHGTVGIEEMDAFTQAIPEEELYILLDADEPGIRLREQFKREFPNAKHIYTRKKYKEVATTPVEYLAKKLHEAHFTLKLEYMPLIYTEEE